MPLILSAGRRCAPGPVLPPVEDFVLVNSVPGIQWTAGASNVTNWLSSFTWGGLGGTIVDPFTMLYRNVIISSGDDLDNLSVIETRDYSSATKAGWTGGAFNWTSNGTDCTLTFPAGMDNGVSPHDDDYPFSGPNTKRAGRADFAFTLGEDFQGHPVTNKLMWLYVEGVGRVYVDINGSGAGPYSLNMNVQNTVNPGAQNYPPNIVPGAAIERGEAVTLRFDVLGNTDGEADGEMHLSYKAA